MRNIFLIAVITLVYSSVMAHNPLTAKFELNATLQEGAILNVYLSQTGLHLALVKYFDQEDFTTIAQKKYKKLAVQYLKKHISIIADDRLIVLGEGGIKLGSHQTDLKFLIEHYPKEVASLDVHLSAFNENDNHHSVFWWKKLNGKSKVILSKRNDFRSILKSDGVVVSSNSFPINGLWITLGLLGFLFSLFVKKRIAQ